MGLPKAREAMCKDRCMGTVLSTQLSCGPKTGVKNREDVCQKTEEWQTLHLKIEEDGGN